MGKEWFAGHWKRTLTPEQQTQIDQLRVNHAKASAPLTAKMGSIKMDLAVLATAEEPDTATIQQHIDEMVELKKKIMQQRYAHIAAVRKVLTQEQRASYDMMILKHATKRKRGRQW
jgi:Spy/CpxP family protein refolding chaperone